jgi:hypothetical protein
MTRVVGFFADVGKRRRLGQNASSIEFTFQKKNLELSQFDFITPVPP